jgi:hypothetical protein
VTLEQGQADAVLEHLEHHVDGAVAFAVFELAGIGLGIGHERADGVHRRVHVDRDHRAR